RLNIFLCLFIHVGHGKIGTERTKRSGTAPGDRVFVGDADDQTAFALKQLGFRSRDKRRPVRSIYLDGLAPQVLLRDSAEISKGLPRVFRICNARDVATVHSKSSFAPRSYIDDIFPL